LQNYCKPISTISNTIFSIAKLSQLLQNLLHLAKIIATNHCTISRLSQDYDQPIAKPHLYRKNCDFIAKPIATYSKPSRSLRSRAR
jgi:hypothetical protein